MKLNERISPSERARLAHARDDARAEGESKAAELRAKATDSIARECGWKSVTEMRAAVKSVRQALHA